MSEQPFDPEQYKQRHRHEWDAAAEGWKKWWPIIEQGGQKVSGRLVEMAGIQLGQRVLDVASGIGEPAVTAASHVGPDGSVVATDYSGSMLAIAQERAAELGLINLETQVVDGEMLDFPASSFDAALCRWGLMLMPDPTESASRVAEALAPGGKFAAAVWGPPLKVPLAGVAMGVIMKALEMPPPPEGAPGIFSLSAPGSIEDVFETAGFSDVLTEEMTVIIELPSADTFVEMFRDTARAVTTMVAEQPAKQQEIIWGQVTAGIQQFATDEGSIRLPNQTICAVGTKQ